MVESMTNPCAKKIWHLLPATYDLGKRASQIKITREGTEALGLADAGTSPYQIIGRSFIHAGSEPIDVKTKLRGACSILLSLHRSVS